MMLSHEKWCRNILKLIAPGISDLAMQRMMRPQYRIQPNQILLPRHLLPPLFDPNSGDGVLGEQTAGLNPDAPSDAGPVSSHAVNQAAAGAMTIHGA